MLSDLRYSLRRLAATPGFTLPALVALSIGIAGNAALFAAVNAILLRPLSFAHPETLIEIAQPRLELPLEELARARTLAGAAAWIPRGFPVGRAGEVVNTYGFRVSPNLFDVLGVRPFLGRLFHAGEEGTPVTVLAYDYWRRMQQPPALTIGGESYTVIGVLPPGFQLQVNDAVIFVPYRMTQGRLAARLASGATAAQAQEELTAILRPGPREQVRVRGVIQTFRTNDASIIVLLEIAVGLVLLITCANIGNLNAARAAGRRREFAIRAAIGAGRARLLRQLAVESLLVGTGGGAIGLLLANASLTLVRSALPGNLIRQIRGGLNLDWRVVAFTAGVSLAAVVLFGMLPAAGALRFDLMGSLRDASAAAPRRGRTAQLLVVAEVGLALMLLIAAGLTVKSLAGMERMNLGFRPEHVLRIAVDMLPARYPRPEQKAAVFAEVGRRLESLPGVEAAGLLTPQFFPFGGPRVRGGRFEIEGRPDFAPRAEMYFGNPGYLRAVGIPLRRGRWFTAADTLNSEPVAAICESLARRWWQGDDPIGRRVKLSADAPGAVWTTVVGVVGDVRNPLAPEVQPTAYRPFAQAPEIGTVFYLKTAGDPSALIPAVRRELKAIDPTAPQFRPALLEPAVHDYISPQRFTTRVLAAFALLGLLLAAAGIYGVMRCWVSARVAEIGVRVALGAARADVIRLVVSSAARAVAIGVTTGIAGAVAVQKLIASELHGVSPVDPAVFAATAAVLMAVGIVAAWLPARRAAGIDPIAALRHE